MNNIDTTLNNNLDLLKYALGHGMIDMSYMQECIEMNKRKELLSKHPYSIWKSKDGKWHTYLPDEKKGRVPRRRNTQKEIEDLVVEYWTTIENNTFKKRYQVWIERQINCGRSDNTISKYQSNYTRFFDGYEIESMNIYDINEDVIAKHFTNLLKSKDIPYRALKEAFGHINGVFEKAIKDKVIEENPCKYVDLEIYKRYCHDVPKKTSVQRTVSLSEKKIILSKTDRQKSMARFATKLALFTGMRVGELAGLKWEDINFDKGIITVQRSEKYNRISKEYYISTTKNCKVRNIPLTDEMRQVLSETKKEELKMGVMSEYVFCDKNGERVHCRTISDHVRNLTLSKEFSSTKSIQAIRRTLNSNLKCLGVSTTVAAGILGHTEKVNEENYTYDISSIDDKREMVEKAGMIS